ncbi:MAG: FAD-dependent oxidoreductase [Nitrospiraceae bacterium]|nr:FAD-dependent oxidoreductase [Nitrospiraceae bacterium]
MKRDLSAMTGKTYDVLIVGGGISGACIARDAALRGLSVGLVEKADFAGATSAASSKLIHGGLRYLQNLEIGLVRESLRERRIWSNTAAHLVDPLTFLMPTSTKERIRGRLKMAIGLTAYDWLAYDRNRLDDPDKEIPPHKHLTRAEAIEAEPGLETDDLSGAMVFYDYQMYSPERLALDCILSAVELGAEVANYAEAVGFIVEGDRVCGVRVRGHMPCAQPDVDREDEFAVRGRMVINAAGPWADLLMAALHNHRAGGSHTERRLLRSKGIHLITRSITNGHAVAVLGESTHFFILPWRGHSLLGTTDTVYEGDPDKVSVTEKDIVDFLAVINEGYPGARLLRSDVLHFYCGLRPIVDPATNVPAKETDEDGAEPEEKDSYGASRAAEVYDHEAEEGVAGVVTVIGGKWTTSRSLAEQVVDLAIEKLNLSPTASTTAETPTFGGNVGRFAEYREQALESHALPEDIVENLVRNYGSHMDDVLALAEEKGALMERLSPRYPDIAAEVVHAVRHEMAVTVDDVLFRRTGLGTLGPPGDDVVARVAAIMAEELGWDDAARTAQIDRAMAKFTSWARTLAIVNPHSWGDRTGAVWPDVKTRLAHAIGPIESVFTDAPMSATSLTARALHEGMEQIIAVGGDGTLNEVVNGFFEGGKPINPEAMLASITSGTGGDFRRTLERPLDIDAQIECLATSEIRSVDLGRLTFVDDHGEEVERYFNNVASFGLSGATDRAVNRLTWAKTFGGKRAFQWGMLKALLTYRNQRVRIQVDEAFDQVMNITVAAVCNGRFFGGGMQIAPKAKPDDGLFDVIILSNLNSVSLLRHLPSVYRGAHLANIHVTALRGRKITATPVESEGEVLLDIDGEAPGRLPATFEIVPGAVFLRS